MNYELRTSPSHYHVCGVGGCGMSALAQALLAEGHAVSGSDREWDTGRALPIFDKLTAVGIRRVPQDGTGISETTTGLVVSTAIEEDNPDVLAARKLGTRIYHRAELLAELLEGKRCVAVTGTSGKSTVTGMIGCMLEQLGADPVVVNGAPVLNWSDDDTIGNFRAARELVDPASGWWVVEADESDRSVLRYHPAWAVITNVSKDHFSVAETQQLFDAFAGQVSDGIVDGAKESALRELDSHQSEHGSEFSYAGKTFHVAVPGRHNAENALLSVMLCERLGFSLDRIQVALRSFRGIERRLETVGCAAAVTVIDDYAHNPAKIRAAWQTVQPYYQRVICVWRPHGYGPLISMMTEVADVFTEIGHAAGRVYVLPVYDAGGTADRNVTSETLVEQLHGRGIEAAVVAADVLAETVAAVAQPRDAILVMGARDPGLPKLARQVLHHLRQHP